ncbi:hypothetical protein TorRG33x02_212700 [Trema orientale]|uniref:Uncharacterized protein n=1 Tax=Trema orientale TaxID=63057 RepID=A0A2P5EBT4_TREOI|nr:hypothetical protein TorRG33x02_212700 [Trema orientale]
MPDFCFIYGRIRHVFKYCNAKVDENLRLSENFQYGNWLKATLVRQIGAYGDRVFYSPQGAHKVSGKGGKFMGLKLYQFQLVATLLMALCEGTGESSRVGAVKGSEHLLKNKKPIVSVVHYDSYTHDAFLFDFTGNEATPKPRSTRLWKKAARAGMRNN